ncbi:MAG: hypothetical protein A4E49_01064 [Methanosaeta sp. PtaU1.Bin112]|nr:MAG: hypothetical protein A4E49_01064 [Methanosaeta sp. PtaU1.Bin112]
MDETRTNIILILFAAIIMSIIINGLFLHLIVKPYLDESNRVVNIFKLYRTLEDDPQRKIFFIGSSQIEADIDCNLIDKLINGDGKADANMTVQTYNLGYPADTPLRRLTEVASMSECRPGMVIIGLTYYALNDTSFNISSDDLALVSRDIHLDNYSRSLFRTDELELIDMNPVYLDFYRRKFIAPSLLNLFRISETSEQEAAKDFKVQPAFSENLTYDLLLIRINNSRDMLDKYSISPRDNNQKLALNQTLRLLHSKGISVVIINMPLHPLLLEKISDDTRRNYFSLLNSTNSSYYDYERRYGPQCFSDLTHLNCLGRKEFSEDMAKLILECAAL